MPFSASIVPSGTDHDVYLLLDQFGERLGRAWRETDEEADDDLIRIFQARAYLRRMFGAFDFCLPTRGIKVPDRP
jgi:hypothetical protein